MIDSAVRNAILQRLHERNKQQRDGFAELICQSNTLHDAAESAEAKKLQLTVELEKLRQENMELQVKLESGAGGTSGKAVQLLEQKLFKQQEELTELHRKKGENTQQLVDLNKAVQDKEKERVEQDDRINKLLDENEELNRKYSKIEQNNMELQATNEILTDEHNALHLAYVKLEEKFRQIADENADLVKRFMKYKSLAADQMNAQNDIMIKKKQQKLQNQLKEAASEPDTVVIPPEPAGAATRAMCFAVTVPSTALHSFEAHEGEVNAITWSPSGRRCATGGSDRKVKIWEISNGRSTNVCTLMGCNAAVMSVQFDLPETHLLAATANDFSVRVWTIGDARLRHPLTGHTGRVTSAKFLSGAHKVASGSHDRTLKIWDLRRGACEKTIFAGSSCFDLVTSDGLATNIISGHFDRKIRFWDTRSDKGAEEIVLQGKVTSLDLSADGTSLLSCSRDDTLNVTDIRMNKIIKTLSDDNFKVGSDYTRAVFSPDAHYALCGSNDGHLFVWNVIQGKLEKVLKDGGHGCTVLACAWDPRGNSVLSSDKQRTVVYWSDF